MPRGPTMTNGETEPTKRSNTPAPWVRSLLSTVVRYAIPLVFGERPHPLISSTLNIASGVVVDGGKGPFLLTASHVVDRIEERANTERFHLVIGRDLELSPDRLIARDRTLDVATMRLTQADVIQLEKDGASVVRPDCWPLPRPSEGSEIVLAGFPKAGRADLSWDEID